MKLHIKPRVDPRAVELFKPGRWARLPKATIRALIHNSTGLRKNDLQLIWAIVHDTLGHYNQMSARIFRERLQELTGLDLSVISKRLSALRARNILRRYKAHSWEQKRAAEWGIEPDPAKWEMPDGSSGQMFHRANRPRIERANHPLKQRKKRPHYEDTGKNGFKKGTAQGHQDTIDDDINYTIG